MGNSVPLSVLVADSVRFNSMGWGDRQQAVFLEGGVMVFLGIPSHRPSLRDALCCGQYDAV